MTKVISSVSKAINRSAIQSQLTNHCYTVPVWNVLLVAAQTALAVLWLLVIFLHSFVWRFIGGVLLRLTISCSAYLGFPPSSSFIVWEILAEAASVVATPSL